MKQTRMSAAQYRAAQAKRRHKYGAKRTVVDGIKFDSKGEHRRWMELKLLERAGKIVGLTRQFKYSLHVNGKLIGVYVVDFFYWRGNEPIAEEYKGLDVPFGKWKRRHAELEYNIKILLTGR